ncbi:MAG: AbiEi antitoxin N-terminal domain-containing protein [Lacunisphaera sp.]
MSQKLNQRLTSAPAAAMLPSEMLKDRGISSRQADYYSRSGWLHRIGDGAFTARPETPTWMGAVYGLQQKPDSIQPGGRTPLEIFGRAHFIPLGANYPSSDSFSRVQCPVW